MSDPNFTGNGQCKNYVITKNTSMKRNILLISILLTFFIGLQAQETTVYNASKFGIRSDGITMNTRSIQKALDWISDNGGGTLRFWVGRYLTGSIHLRSNVNIDLQEGAILVGSTNPYDYDKVAGCYALVIGEKISNLQITGKGMIEGNGRELANNFTAAVHAGIIKDALKYDRVSSRPRLLYLRECQRIKVEGITLKNAADWVQTYDQCVNVTVNNIRVESTAFWNNDGIDIVDCNHFLLSNSYINASDDAICLKSHSREHVCQNVEVRNCTARSSASGIKFGTFALGGFRNIRIINNKVYDTHRSAITIQSVDGGICENILVDSLHAVNTSNPIYVVVGERRDRPSSMHDVTIRNLYCEVPADKADSGYPYEGPVEDNPRNPSPSGIVGLPGNPVTNITLENIKIVYPGGGDPHLVCVDTNHLDLVPEMPKAYPEFSQHKELPAWGLYVRHAQNVTLRNISFTAQKPDYRVAIVLDDVKGHTLENVQITEPNGEGKQIVFERK